MSEWVPRTVSGDSAGGSLDKQVWGGFGATDREAHSRCVSAAAFYCGEYQFLYALYMEHWYRIKYDVYLTQNSLTFGYVLA